MASAALGNAAKFCVGCHVALTGASVASSTHDVFARSAGAALRPRDRDKLRLHRQPTMFRLGVQHILYLGIRGAFIIATVVVHTVCALVLVLRTNIAVLLGYLMSSRQCDLYYLLTYTLSGH